MTYEQKLLPLVAAGQAMGQVSVVILTCILAVKTPSPIWVISALISGATAALAICLLVSILKRRREAKP